MENYCGKRLDGRYEIREIIGVGGMSVVYKAYDNIDDRIVAVKILKEEYLTSEESRRRFKNESKAIAVLSHPNIVKVFDVSFGDRIQYIVEEYIEGITLKEYIEQQGKVNWKECVHFVSQILLALQHAHDKGIVHRDIKPQNIMLLQDGTIKVADFGIARFSRDDTRTMTEDAIGSVHYISPEQARGEITDERSDIYSIGVVMYEMLTGELPFQSDNAVSIAIMQLQQEAKPPREVNPEIPLGLEQITMRAMQKNPNSRYHSASEMMLDIDEFKRNPSIKFNYNYFVDEEPTKFVDRNQIPSAVVNVSKVSDDKAAPVKINDEDEEELDATPNKTGPILLGVVAGLLVVVAIILGIVFFGGGKKVAVPNFVGLNYKDDILSNSEYTETFKFETEFVNSDQEPGTVLEQNPKAETKVRKNKTIKLKIASNDSNVLISGILGLDANDAETKLKKDGFTVEILTQYDKNSKGIVVNIDPSEGTYAPKGSTVRIYISTDQNPDAIKVPDVVKIQQDMAIQTLKNQGLTVTVTNQDSNLEKGLVVSQEPASGAEVEKGSNVTIYVSTGVPTDNTASIDVKLPTTTGSSTGTMKVFVGSDLYQIYNDVLLNGSTKTVEVKGKGTQTVTVKINDQTVMTADVDFSQSPANIKNKQTSDYTEQLSVPNVVGMSASEAKKTLQAAGFKNITIYDESHKVVESGTVKSQTPNASSTGTSSQPITLTVG